MPKNSTIKKALMAPNTETATEVAPLAMFHGLNWLSNLVMSKSCNSFCLSAAFSTCCERLVTPVATLVASWVTCSAMVGPAPTNTATKKKVIAITTMASEARCGSPVIRDSALDVPCSTIANRMPAKTRKIAVFAYQSAAATASTTTTPSAARMAVWVAGLASPCAWLTMAVLRRIARSVMASLYPICAGIAPICTDTSG